MSLKIKNFSLIKNKKIILEDISMEIFEGQCISISGENGSGKTLLLESLSKIIPLIKDANIKGEILFNEKKDYSFSILLDDLNSQFLFETLEEEVDFFFDKNNFTEFKDKNSFLSKFKISNLLNKKTLNLSSGEKQKVLLAFALSFSKDKVLFLDEALSYIDYSYSLYLKDLLIDLKNKGYIIILTGNNFSILKSVIDEYFIIRDKKLFKYKNEEIKYIKKESKNILKDKILEAINLSFKYKNEEKFIFKNLNLSLYKNSIYGFYGPNGSGKTTLAKIISGLLKNYEGKINTKLKESDIFYVSSQVLNQLFYPNVKENLKSFDIKEEDILKILNILNIKENNTMLSLSFSQRQKLLLCIGCFVNKELLIIDEPLFNFDFQREEKIYNLMNEYALNKSILIFSHRKDFLNNFCDDIFYMEEN